MCKNSMYKGKQNYIRYGNMASQVKHSNTSFNDLPAKWPPDLQPAIKPHKIKIIQLVAIVRGTKTLIIIVFS